MWRQRADVCQGISAAYLELFHSDLTLENVSPSALAFQMHDGTLALTGAKQQTFKEILKVSPNRRRHSEISLCPYKITVDKSAAIHTSVIKPAALKLCSECTSILTFNSKSRLQAHWLASKSHPLGCRSSGPAKW